MSGRRTAVWAVVLILATTLVALLTVSTIRVFRERAEALRLVDATLAELEQVRAQADRAAVAAEQERDELLLRIEALTRQVEELQEQVRELGGTPVTPAADTDEDDPTTTSSPPPDPPPPRRDENPPEPRAPPSDPDPPPEPEPSPSRPPAPPPDEPDPDPPIVCVLDLCIP